MNLTPVQLGIICDIFAHHLPGRAVQLFGSRAVGRAKSHSDIDLVIMGEESLSVTTMRKLRDAFDDSDLPYHVDLVEWATTSDEFRKVIMLTAMPLVT